MATTARISKIENLTTLQSLEEYFKSNGLPLRPGNSISLAQGESGCKVATVSFFNEAALEKALDLSRAKRVLNDCTFDIDNKFKGFTVLSDGVLADFVAMHGMNGHAFNSWEFKDDSGQAFMWLRDCLPGRLPNTRVMVYGHEANILCDISADRLRIHAEAFLEGLLEIRNWNLATDRPLVLLAHSMGGLIMKEALVLASARKDRRYRSILNSVRGVIFLGTPHRSTHILEAGGFLAMLMNFFDPDARIDIKSLKTNLRTKVVSDVSQKFRALANSKGIRIGSILETKKTKLGIFFNHLIVEEQAAILGADGELKIRADVDHMALSKFRDSEDKSLSAIIQVIEDFRTNSKPPTIVKPIIALRLSSDRRGVSEPSRCDLVTNGPQYFILPEFLPPPAVAATLRVSNIGITTTEKDLTDYLESLHLLLSIDHRISFTLTERGRKQATVSFFDEETCKKALSLEHGEARLKDSILDFDDEFEGFTVLSKCTSSKVDIVALHGMNGHAFNSWDYRDNGGYGFMWLRDCLPERVPDARIMVYGYDANILDDLSSGRIHSFAETFLENLRQARSANEVKDRPLILLGHSLGGLIIKQALMIANIRADRRFDFILNSVCGVIFIGTPHGGMNGVDNMTFLTNFARVFNVDIRTDLINEQNPNSWALFDLTNDFKQLIAAKNIEIATLFETKKTKFRYSEPIWIVDEQSATLGVASERKAYINANHTNLCKFEDAEDNSLTMIIDYIKEFYDIAVPHIASHHQSSLPSPPEGLKFKLCDDPNKFGVGDSYPVLIVGEYCYYALAYIDDRDAIVIVAFDRNGNDRRKWPKPGARYVQRIEYCELDGSRQIMFVGHDHREVYFHLAELKATGPGIM